MIRRDPFRDDGGRPGSVIMVGGAFLLLLAVGGLLFR